MNNLRAILIIITVGLNFQWAAAQTGTPPASIPEFLFTKLGGGNFTKGNLKPNKAVVFMLFDPGCDHCQAQTKIFTGNAARLANVQFMLITTEQEAQYIHKFRAEYLANTALDVTLLQDARFSFDRTFTRSPVPSIYIYGADGRFRKGFQDSQVSADQVLQAIR